MKIKKILTIFLICSFFINSIILVSSKENIIQSETLTVSYSQPIIYQSNDNEDIINIETNSQVIKQNYYVLPKDIKEFSFPKNTKIINIEVIPKNISSKIIFQKLKITPQPFPLSIINQQIEYTNNQAKTIDYWYDYFLGSGIKNNNRSLILTVELYPVKYNPEENLIQWVDTFEINIEYQSTTNQTINNNEEIFDLLIISPNEFKTSLQNLVSHKNLMNVSSKLVTLKEIYNGEYFDMQGYDEQEQIKYFIKNAIETWEITSVLLVGSAEIIPTRLTHINVGDFDKEIFVSDLYYADIYNETNDFSTWDTNNNHIYAEYDWDGETDDLDLYPDIYIGRLACIDINEVDTVVNKIISFETNEHYKEHWFSNLIVIGGDSFPGDADEVLEGEFVNTKVIELMDGFIPTKIWASNGALGGANPTGSSIILNTINNGAGFIDFSGHGNTQKYATHPFEMENIWLPTPYGGYSNSDIKKLDNNEKLPIVVTGACSVAKFNKDDDCFSWSFLINPNGGGIGSFGSTGLGYAYLGKDVTYGLVEKMATDMFKAYENNVKTLGEMWAYGIERNIKSRMDATEYKTVEEWQLFGDPTLKIAGDSQSPQKPIISGPTSGRKGKVYTYEASATDIDNDSLYYCFDWGDGTFSEWLGPYESGESISTSNSWTEKGENEIRVSVKDEQGTHSKWSDPLPISISKNNKFKIFDFIFNLLFKEKNDFLFSFLF